MKFFAQITKDNKIIPLYNGDADELARVPKDADVEIEIKKKRNIKFHKKFFALMNICFQNQDCFEYPEPMRAYLIMKAGFFDIINTPSGKPMILAKSISFSSMDDIGFEILYSRVLDQVLKLTNADKELVEKELLNFM
jgi:hypothetical protein